MVLGLVYAATMGSLRRDKRHRLSFVTRFTEHAHLFTVIGKGVYKCNCKDPNVSRVLVPAIFV